MSLRLFISVVAAIMLLSVNPATAGDIIIIGNKSVDESKLNKQDLKNIYLGRKTAWSNNKKIIFVTLDNEGVSDRFLVEYLNMIAAQYSDYWLNKVFTGQGSPPRSLTSDEEMIRFVARTEGAIGYISSDKGLNNVKIFEIEQ